VYAWFLKTEPTCFDGKQNQDERGVDCGGACALVCMSDTRNLIIEWQRTVPVVDDVYNSVAYIENQNADAGIEQFNYKFKVYDDENIIITERTGTTFVQPNERAIIFEPSITTGEREPFETFFEITSVVRWQKTDEDFTQRLVVIEDQELENVDSRPRLTATLRTTVLTPVYDIQVIALLYDAEGILRASSATEMPSIAGSSTREVFFTWPTAFTHEITRIEIVPRINVFSDSNQRQYAQD